MNWKAYLNRGYVKKIKPDLLQIERQLARAEKDMKTFGLVVKQDPEWGSTIAYQAMLRVGRALMFAHGYLPADGQQHKTVVEITGDILGKDYNMIVRRFDRMRKQRNIFFYDSEDAHNMTEAERSLKNARSLISAVKERIRRIDPQGDLKL